MSVFLETIIKIKNVCWEPPYHSILGNYWEKFTGNFIEKNSAYRAYVQVNFVTELEHS